jgi:uncharacterized phage protein gp47/JayE
MAGLTPEGFTKKTFEEIKTSIQSRLEQYNPGFDFSIASPDGQLVEIFGYEMSVAWDELAQVYDSYNPSTATGQALRNIGHISGLAYEGASRSNAHVTLSGTAGVIVPAGSVVSDSTGEEYVLEISIVIPGTGRVIAKTAGPVPVTAGTINNVVTSINGWTGVTQGQDGEEGLPYIPEETYRNLRNRVVMRNNTSVTEHMVARLSEAGVAQLSIVNNDSVSAAPDGTPAQTIHVTIGDKGTATNEDIAAIILETKGLACPTHGTTTVNVTDSQGVVHQIKFTEATPIDIFVNMEVTFLSDDVAGAVEGIKKDVAAHINSLLAGEDVIWSHLFGVITPYGDAQVDLLEIGKSLLTVAPANVDLSSLEYATCDEANISITVN